MTPDRIIAAVIAALLLVLLVTVLTIAAIDHQETRHRGKHRRGKSCGPEDQPNSSST